MSQQPYEPLVPALSVVEPAPRSATRNTPVTTLSSTRDTPILFSARSSTTETRPSPATTTTAAPRPASDPARLARLAQPKRQANPRKDKPPIKPTHIHQKTMSEVEKLMEQKLEEQRKFFLDLIQKMQPNQPPSTSLTTCQVQTGDSLHPPSQPSPSAKTGETGSSDQELVAVVMAAARGEKENDPPFVASSDEEEVGKPRREELGCLLDKAAARNPSLRRDLEGLAMKYLSDDLLAGLSLCPGSPPYSPDQRGQGVRRREDAYPRQGHRSSPPYQDAYRRPDYRQPEYPQDRRRSPPQDSYVRERVTVERERHFGSQEDMNSVSIAVEGFLNQGPHPSEREPGRPALAPLQYQNYHRFTDTRRTQHYIREPEYHQPSRIQPQFPRPESRCQARTGREGGDRSRALPPLHEYGAPSPRSRRHLFNRDLGGGTGRGRGGMSDAPLSMNAWDDGRYDGAIRDQMEAEFQEEYVDTE